MVGIVDLVQIILLLLHGTHIALLEEYLFSWTVI
ncbi:hypothetical protein swp_5035 [Shewanella piezotolerans WP3]|uniref:Uncharacterized protein n=1 Tax=Shewanella piezotolerans (strain WP3 / JCM 13877) TaxID=225849 RepID=B8CVH3_SHEPW|nr:hypothetical protein swp_5035 [Shewanella piezotolerans WP3]